MEKDIAVFLLIFIGIILTLRNDRLAYDNRKLKKENSALRDEVSKNKIGISEACASLDKINKILKGM